MALKAELLKPIWHAFTALDVDKSGKVSKSQLKVLSHSLCTLLNVPHDPVALEEHFRDDDEGPVSTQGYMPYLNKFILDKAHEGFDKIEFNRMCWTLCAKKNLTTDPLLISDSDAFKVWSIFNFLSEEKYPLFIVSEEIEYLLKKLTDAMGVVWQQALFEDYKLDLDSKQNGLSVWKLIELIGNGHFSKSMDKQTISMAINEVYVELILNVVKQGYMWKKGHKRKNWTERWFILKPSILSYYAHEDLKDKKGEILLDENCFVESLPDKDGKKCLFVIKCLEKSYEISASDKKKRQEWIQAITSTLNLRRLGTPLPHKTESQKRRALRQKRQAEQERREQEMRELQMENKKKQQELEALREKQKEAAARAAEEERARAQNQHDLKEWCDQEIGRLEQVRLKMEEQVAIKSYELQHNSNRLQELKEMYEELYAALEEEKKARQDEETVRILQARLLEEEAQKREELEKWHQQQTLMIQTTEKEKQELESQRILKDRALKVAMEQLEQLNLERLEALEQYQEVKKKLDLAASKTNSWKDKVTHHGGLLPLIQPGAKTPGIMTNWGPAAFTELELDQRKKTWQDKNNIGAESV